MGSFFCWRFFWGALVIYFLYGLYQLIRTKFRNLFSHILKLTAFISVLYFCFYFFWGLNYFRETLAKNLNLKQSPYTTEELVGTTKLIITKLNRIQLKITHNDTLKSYPSLYTKRNI